MSARITTGNSSPFARCTVMMRTPSVPSSTIGASPVLGALRVGLELLDEGAERGDALALRAPRQVEQAADVRQRLLARRPDGEPRVRAHGGEESARSCRRTGRRLRWRCRSRSTASASATGAGCAGGRLRRQLRGRDASDRWRSRQASSAPSSSAKNGPRSGREERQLVVGPLDREERVAQRLDLLAGVERAAADQHVAEVARLERPHVGRVTSAFHGSHAAEEQADVPACDGSDLLAGAVGSVTRQPLAVTSHSTKAPRRRAATPRSRSRRCPIAEGLRHRQRHRAAGRALIAEGRQRDVAAWGPTRSSPAAGRTRRSRPSGSPARSGSSTVRCTTAAPRARAAGASPARRGRRRRAGSGRSTASDRRPGRACPARGRPAASRASAGSRPRAAAEVSACSGSVSWNSSTKRCVNRRCELAAHVGVGRRTRSRARSRRSRKSRQPARALSVS